MRNKYRNRARLGLLAALSGVVLALVAMLAGAPGAAAANVPGRVTLLIHGYDPSLRADCRGQMGLLANDLTSGLSRNVVTIGYFQGDTNCNVNLHTIGSYGDSGSWKEVSKALSRYIYNTYTSRGVKVDALGYSLGGVILRGAVYGAQLREVGFSPPIDVGNAVTLGSPFHGAIANTLGCPGMCGSFARDSPDITWLLRSDNPQGSATTLWTIFASNADSVVAVGSATDIWTWPDRKFVLDNVNHVNPGNYTDLRWVIQLVRQSMGGQTSRIYSGFTANRCLDVKLMATANGTPVQTFDCNNTYAQFWTRQATGQQTQISALGKCLDRSYNGTANGTVVWLWTCNGSPAQQWTQYSDRTIRSAGVCLTATGNWANNAPFIVYTCNGGGGQLWS